MTPRPDPYLAGLRLLGRRELSAAQLRERLARRGYAEADIDRALARLRAEGALDDARTARAYASTAARVKGRGRIRILRELEAMGLEPDVARAAVEDVFAELDEAELLERAIRKRLHGAVTSEAQLRRLHQALARLGFAPSAIAAALRQRVGRQASDQA